MIGWRWPQERSLLFSSCSKGDYSVSTGKKLFLLLLGHYCGRFLGAKSCYVLQSICSAGLLRFPDYNKRDQKRRSGWLKTRPRCNFDWAILIETRKKATFKSASSSIFTLKERITKNNEAKKLMIIWNYRLEGWTGRIMKWSQLLWSLKLLSGWTDRISIDPTTVMLTVHIMTKRKDEHCIQKEGLNFREKMISLNFKTIIIQMLFGDYYWVREWVWMD